VSDKTEEPTPRKLAKSREKGEAWVSATSAQSIAFLVAVLMVPATIAAAASEAGAMLKSVIASSAAPPLDHERAVRAVVSLVAPPLLACKRALSLRHAERFPISGGWTPLPASARW
jgi:flagellar biosynthesis protein FlhB